MRSQSLRIIPFRRFRLPALPPTPGSPGSLWAVLTVLALATACQPQNTPQESLPPSPELSESAPSSPSASEPESLDSIPRSYRVDRAYVQRQCCDGSSAVALDEAHFLVGNDENSIVRVYARTGSPEPVLEINLRKFLDLKKKDQESDLEGMTRIGSQIYGIASHSRSKGGAKRKERRRLFALQLDGTGPDLRLTPIGSPYTKLIDALSDHPPFRPFGFEEAAKQPGDDKDGLNIEGLASTPDGGLLIGLRTPLHEGKTLLIPLKNPAQVIYGAPPQFGPAQTIRMGEMGIRGLERYGDSYLIATESTRGKKSPQLFTWRWNENAPQRLFVALPKDLNPESVLLFPDTGLQEIHLLSDDGNEEVGSTPCNELDREDQQRFRRLVLTAQ